MSTQISLQLSDRIYARAKDYAHANGFDTLQEFIRELIRDRLFKPHPEPTGGVATYLASEEALARNWLTPEEEQAWEHLQEPT